MKYSLTFLSSSSLIFLSSSSLIFLSSSSLIFLSSSSHLPLFLFSDLPLFLFSDLPLFFFFDLPLFLFSDLPLSWWCKTSPIIKLKSNWEWIYHVKYPFQSLSPFSHHITISSYPTNKHTSNQSNRQKMTWNKDEISIELVNENHKSDQIIKS